MMIIGYCYHQNALSLVVLLQLMITLVYPPYVQVHRASDNGELAYPIQPARMCYQCVNTTAHEELGSNLQTDDYL